MIDDDLPADDIDAKQDDKTSAKAWLAEIDKAQAAFDDYHSRCDRIEKLYANLSELANTGRDRQFQMFWANVQVLGPAIYSRRPVPVVVPRFRNQKPLYRTTAEFLERATVVSFDSVDDLMKLVRDNLSLTARGAGWVRYETKSESGGETERVCYEHADRKDFLHQPARNWAEVDWVAKRSWLARKAMRARFGKSSGKKYQEATYSTKRDDPGSDRRQKAGVWEIWCRSQNKVVWVTEGVDVCLDEGKPHLKLEGFFPCPKPAYGTVEPRSLMPVPDFVQYKDQLEEINELTGRISALSGALRVKGFYQGGQRDLSDAIEAAMRSIDDEATLVPVAAGALSGQSMKDAIVWLPLDMVAETIVQLVNLRRQLIEDVYQITGLSDIMRGSTEASETATAQQLKSQYGSIRIRDRQDEMVRFALDLTRIGAEIIAENFSKATLVDMTQMDLPTDAELAKKVKPIRDQAKALNRKLQDVGRDPQIAALAQEHPDQAQQLVVQAQQQIAQLEQQADEMEEEIVTIEEVMKFLKDQRLRPFVLDIETDSTIAPDENAQKQRATEYLTAMGGLLAQAVPALQAMPQMAPMIGDTIKWAQSQFRVGRALDQSVDEFCDAMKQFAKQPPPDPNAAANAKGQAEAQIAQQDAQLRAQAHQADMQAKEHDAALRTQEAERKEQMDQERSMQAADAHKLDSQIKIALADQKAIADGQKHQQDMDKGALEIEKLKLEIQGVQVKTAGVVAQTEAKVDQANQQTDNAVRTTDAGIAATERSTELKAEQAEAKEPA